jgi:hypothetical protein
MTPRQYAIAWFLDNEIRLFPIKAYDKVPACASWDDFLATPAEAADWINYGVVLGQLAVIDTDTPEAEAWVTQHLPPTPFMVTTGRGVHRYYQLGSNDAPHFLHRGGHTIEFRHAGQYVVGPGSIHASGAVYLAADWAWNLGAVPWFPLDAFAWDDRPAEAQGSGDGQPLVLPPVIAAGERHDLLFKWLRSLQARGVEDLATLLALLRDENQTRCVPPLPDAELTRYITRVAAYHDRPDFVRRQTIDAVTLAGELIDAGVGREAAISAAQRLDPTFDPSGRAPAQPLVAPPPLATTELALPDAIVDIEELR